MKSYEFESVNDLAKRASFEVSRFLKKQKGYTVTNVEHKKEYQSKDIDLIVETSDYTFTLEIKADRYYNTGNYFLETVSNTTENTLGCILYSEATFLGYYFIHEKELHIIPMKKLRDWLLENMERFEERSTSTEYNGEVIYYTLGRIVPREIISSELGVTVRKL